MSFKSAANHKAIELCKLVVEMTTRAGSGHPTTALSLSHLVTVLLYSQMRWDPANPWNAGADRLVLSEGHAVPILYAAWADLGAFIGRTPAEGRPLTCDDLWRLREIDSPLDGHPNPGLGLPLLDIASGSLGQGLSVAAGLASAARMDGSCRNIYCLIGDGESREGQVWEALDFLVDKALTNVVTIFNCNELGQSDWVSAQQGAATIARKAQAFGAEVCVIDGHDPCQIKQALAALPVIQNGRKPLVIVARTVKGWGAPIEFGTGKHGAAVKPDQIAIVLSEMDQTAHDLGAEQPDDGAFKIPAVPAAVPAQAKLKQIAVPSFDDAMQRMGFLEKLKAGQPLATRKAYGVALLMLGQADPRVIALDGDVKNSTHSEWLARALPGQFLECRIAEQNMIGVAAGAAAAGKIPFCSTFAKFFMRACDQIEMAVISGANIKLTGSHAGVTLAADGPSQMGVADVAFFRAYCHVKNYDGVPAVRYFFPSDAVSAYRLTELMANVQGCCYQRTLRTGTPLLYPFKEQFEVDGFKVLREGRDVCLIGAGYMVHECLNAANMLASQGRSAAVIDAYAFPLQSQALLEVAARSGGRIVTVEDNYTGGLDAELATAIAGKSGDFTLRRVFVQRLPKSGRQPGDLLKFLNINAEAIATEALAFESAVAEQKA